jgi:hypothetical protein
MRIGVPKQTHLYLFEHLISFHFISSHLISSHLISIVVFDFILFCFKREISVVLWAYFFEGLIVPCVSFTCENSMIPFAFCVSLKKREHKHTNKYTNKEKCFQRFLFEWFVLFWMSIEWNWIESLSNMKERISLWCEILTSMMRRARGSRRTLTSSLWGGFCFSNSINSGWSHNLHCGS